MSEESQEHSIMRTIEKALHDRGLVVVSHVERGVRVVQVEDASTRRVSIVRIEPEKK